MTFDDNLQEPFLEDSLEGSPGPSPSLSSEAKPQKRKRDSEIETDEAIVKIPKQKKKKKTSKVLEEDEFDLSIGINKAFSNMDSQLLADYMAQRTKKYESELSSIELEDRYISANSIRDSTSWKSPRILDNLPSFLEQFAPNPTKLWSASKKNGAPHTIIVAGAGLRAADIARMIRNFTTKDAAVAKLFAKHIKLKDAIRFLKSTRTGIAVGTPARLDDLMEDGALATDRLERVIIDASHIDQKKRGILEMGETQIPLAKWLNRPALKERFGATSDAVDLLFY